MKIFGYRLPKQVRYVHEEDSDDCPDCLKINPEELHGSACHLYEDSLGIQYIGFEVSLKMSKDTMIELIKDKKLRYYTIN